MKAQTRNRNKIKYLKPLTAALILVFAVGTVASASDPWSGYRANYDYYDNESRNTLDDVKSVAYDCENEDCSTVSSFGGSYPDGQTTSSGTITIDFPADLNNDKYALYHFADGYLPWEDRPSFHCNDDYDWCPSEPAEVDRYMVKADQCTSTVDSFSIKNEVYADEPVVANITADVEGDVESAFENKDTGISHVPEETTAPGDSKTIKNKYYSATTDIKLIVDGSIERTVTKDIYMDKNVDIGFKWTPSSTGTKDVKIKTEVVDDQCKTKGVSQSSSQQVDVQEARPQNEYYTRINNLAISDTNPKATQNVHFDFEKISNYAYDDYSKTAVGTDINYDIKDSGGTVVKSGSLELPANSGTSYELYDSVFSWTPSSQGTYTITVTGESEEEASGTISNPPKSPATVSMTKAVDEEPSWTVKFDVQSDGSTALEDADVTFDGNTQQTDSNGITKFTDVDEGSYSYTVDKSGYVSEGGTIKVKSDSPTTITESPRLGESNTPPEVSGIPDINIAEGGSDSIDLDNYVTDETADSKIDWSYSGNSNINININDQIATLTPDSGYTGSETITFTATDEQGMSDSGSADTTDVSVTSSNSAPTVSSISDISLDEDSSRDGAVNLKEKVSDDRDSYSELGVSLSTSSDKCGITLRSGYLIDIYPNSEYSGSCTATVTATDSDGASSSETFTVTVNAVNDPPVISPSAPTVAPAYSVYKYDMTVHDPDDSTSDLTFSVLEGPSGLAAKSDGVFKWDRPTNADAGTDSVKLQVSDGEYTDTESYDLTVTSGTPTDKPVANISVNTTKGGAPLNVEFDASNSSDPDGSITSYDWAFGEGGTATGETAVYTYTTEGVYTAELTLTDNDGATSTETVEINVTGNKIPRITSSPETSAEKGEVYSYNVQATDGDGDTLYYSLEESPSGMSIGRTTGQISWRPPTDNDQNVSVKVSDGKEAVYQNYTISVVDKTDESGYELEWNRTFSDQEVFETETFEYPVNVTYNGSAGDLSWNVREPGFTVSGTGKTVNITNSSDMTPGKKEILVEVYDGFGSYISAEFNLTIKEALGWNSEPSDQTIDEGERYSQDLSGNVDYVGNKTNLTWNITENEDLFKVDQGLVEDKSELDPGTYSIGLNVSDNTGREINASYALTVDEEVNSGGGGGGGSSGGGGGGGFVVASVSQKQLNVSVTPETIAEGGAFKVSGILTESEGDEEVNISVDGGKRETVEVDDEGYYEAFLTAEGIGEKELTAKVEDLEATADYEVVEQVNANLSYPNLVEVDERFTICSQNSKTAEVSLYREEQLLNTEEGERTCFNTALSESGTFEYTLEITADGSTTEQNFTVGSARPTDSGTQEFDFKSSDESTVEEPEESGDSMLGGGNITGSFAKAASSTGGKVGISIVGGVIVTILALFAI